MGGGGGGSWGGKALWRGQAARHVPAQGDFSGEPGGGEGVGGVSLPALGRGGGALPAFMAWQEGWILGSRYWELLQPDGPLARKVVLCQMLLFQGQ